MELFANPKIFLYASAVAIALAVCGLLGARARRAALKAFFGSLWRGAVARSTQRRRLWADVLFLAALALLFTALAGPQWGRGAAAAQGEYAQVVIGVDISNSMLAQDFKPNRLQAAKTMLAMLLADIDARAGLVAFTSQAYLQCPVTADIPTLQNLAAQLAPGAARVQGTAIAPALNLAAKMLAPYAGKKAFILVTDGEDHSPQDILAASHAAREAQIRVIAVGIGSAEGELIPVLGPGGAREYKKDKEGKTVLTKLDEAALINLANATGGVYIKYSAPQTTAEALLQQLAVLDKSAAASGARGVYKNRYQIALAMGVLLLLSSILIPLRKVK